MKPLKSFIRFLDRTDGSLYHKAIRSGVWVGLSSLLSAAFSFLRSIVLARLLMPEVFGLMAVCSIVIRGVEVFTETGFSWALIQRQQSFDEARDTAFTLLVLRGGCLAILVGLLAPWVAVFYGQPVLHLAVTLLGISFFLNGFQNMNKVALEKELNFKRLMYLEQISAVLNTLVAVGLAYMLRSVWALVYAQIAASAISVTLSYLIVPGRPRFRFDPAIAKELFAYGKFMTGVAIVVFLTSELDNALIGKMLGMEALGYYTIAYTLAHISGTNLSKVIAKVIFPMFSKLQADLVQLRIEYARAIKLVTTVVVPTSVGVMVMAPEIVSLLYGDQWSQAVVPLKILTVFSCFQALGLVNIDVFNAIGKPHINFSMNFVRLIMVAGLLYPLTLFYGLPGASMAVAIPMTLQFFAGIVLTSKVIGAPIGASVRPLGIAISQSVVLALLLIGAKSLVVGNSVIGLGLLIVFAACVVLIFNLRDVQTLLTAGGLSPFSARQEP